MTYQNTDREPQVGDKIRVKFDPAKMEGVSAVEMLMTQELLNAPDIEFELKSGDITLLKSADGEYDEAKLEFENLIKQQADEIANSGLMLEQDPVLFLRFERDSLLAHCNELRKQLKAKQSGWISVETRFPDDLEFVNAMEMPCEARYACHMEGRDFVSDETGEAIRGITHWEYAKEPPQC